MILKILFYIILIIFISYLNKYLTTLSKKLSISIEELELKRKSLLVNGISSLYENKLISMDYDVLINWCESYLSSLGYEDIYIESENIFCSKDNKKYFVKCIHKEDPSNDSEFENILLYQLIGEMTSKKFSSGIIISTASLSNDWNNTLIKLKKILNLDYHDKEIILDNCLKYKIRI